MTPEEKRLARNEREKLRLREKRGGLKPKPTLEQRIETARKKREYNRNRQRKIRQQEQEMVKQILQLNQ